MLTLHIKNMVCDRCVFVVKDILRQVGVTDCIVTLGEAVITDNLTENELKDLSVRLEAMGFEIIDDRRSRIVERIKACIRELVHKKNCALRTTLSDYISAELHLDYSYLSGIFTESEGRTIENYLILQKIERVKELLAYDNMQLSEIAFLLNYSSVAYLSSQFKKVTGFTPSYFKQMSCKQRKAIDKV